jgi:hypothetical protein
MLNLKPDVVFLNFVLFICAVNLAFKARLYPLLRQTEVRKMWGL